MFFSLLTLCAAIVPLEIVRQHVQHGIVESLDLDRDFDQLFCHFPNPAVSLAVLRS
jgi:hypothetical protein